MRPNYFVGIRLQCPLFAESIENIQNDLKQRCPDLTKCCVSLSKLHLTCFVMQLDSTSVNLAKDVFLSLASDIQQDIRCHERQLSFKNVGRFKTNVLYAEPLPDNTILALNRLTQLISNAFIEHELLGNDERYKLVEWKPHVTIAKTSADRKRGRYLKIRDTDCEGLDRHFNDMIRCPLSTIDLLSMTEIDEDGYYKSVASISLA